MNRRFFLRSAAILAASGAYASSDKYSFLARNPASIIKPDLEIIIPRGNRLLTSDMMAREVLRVLHKKIKFMEPWDEREFNERFDLYPGPKSDLVRFVYPDRLNFSLEKLHSQLCGVLP